MKFNDVVKNNTINDDYNPGEYFTYFKTMYKTNADREREEKQNEKNRKNSIDRLIDDYLREISDFETSDLASDYLDALDDKEKQGATPEITSRINSLEKKLKEKYIRIQRFTIGKSTAAVNKAKDDGVFLTFNEFKEKIKNLNELTESIKKDKLTLEEKTLIFGKIRNDIEDLLCLEEKASVTQGNVNRANEIAMQTEIAASKDKGNINLQRLANQTRVSANNAKADKIQQDIRDKNSKDPLTKENITEEETPLNKEEEIVAVSSDGKSILKAGKIEKIEEVNEEMSRISPDLRFEKRVGKDLRREKLASKDLRYEKRTVARDISKYTSMLFNGESGDLLKYIINNEINNKNVKNLEILKLMKANPEVEIIVKKIQFLLKKAGRKDLTNDEYTQLKIYKSQFKTIFSDCSKQYENRYKK